MSYVLEGKLLNEAKPSAINFILIHNECNFFPKLHEKSCDYMLII